MRRDAMEGGGLRRPGRRLAPVVLAVAAATATACEVPTGLPRFEPTFIIPAEDVSLPVIGQPTSATVTDDLAGVDDSMSERVLSGALIVEVDNEIGATGTVAVTIANDAVTVHGTIDLAGPARQRIDLTGEEVRALIGTEISLSGAGTLCPSAGCGSPVSPPPPSVSLRNRIELRLGIGGES